MKGKKSAFANSSTGYGKSKHGSSQILSKNIGSKNLKTPYSTKDSNKEADKSKLELVPENDLNSGFGDYLRSAEAVEMMKLFVFANSIMLILTMAWPNIKEQYYWLMHWLYQEE